jgi:putative ubiquitin-RnfH superfamily antitoxin RatB of RatAB toxin-antitoxin module
MRFTAKHPMSEFEVEIVFALPDRQSLKSVPVATGETVADVVAKSGLRADFPEIEIDSLAVGIWGREADRTQPVKEGDRIEVYRPLEMDPREARRTLAQSGRTMGSADRD